ncbi:DNA-directed RNA polymerase III subunit RPC1-like [Ruditapes philippinarum]|uniref:DNA-directed RNA polymerase III subunit RPC1-like n=1 Tax=Ruditapes philippinarum TaxID=129788 RepID=UPI00295AF64E|nr:DNA-directed RNA polymerase III subunit RPC1-like [Ruditapes philippinarum]
MVLRKGREINEEEIQTDNERVAVVPTTADYSTEVGQPVSDGEVVKKEQTMVNTEYEGCIGVEQTTFEEVAGNNVKEQFCEEEKKVHCEETPNTPDLVFSYSITRGCADKLYKKVVPARSNKAQCKNLDLHICKPTPKAEACELVYDHPKGSKKRKEIEDESSTREKYPVKKARTDSCSQSFTEQRYYSIMRKLREEQPFSFSHFFGIPFKVYHTPELFDPSDMTRFVHVVILSYAMQIIFDSHSENQSNFNEDQEDVTDRSKTTYYDLDLLNVNENNQQLNHDLEMLNDGNHDLDQLNDGNLYVDQLNDGNVDVDHLNDGSHDLDHLNDGNLDVDHLNDGNLDLDHLNDGNLDVDHLNDGNLDLDQMNDGNLDVDHLNDGNHDLDQLNDGNLYVDQLNDGNLDLDHLNDGSHDLDHLNDGNLDVDQLNDGNLDVDHLNDGNHDIDHLNYGNLDVDQLNDGNHDLDNLNDGNHDLDHLNDGSLDVDQLNEGSHDLDHLNDGSLDVDQLNEGSHDLDQFNKGKHDVEQLNDDNNDLDQLHDNQCIVHSNVDNLHTNQSNIDKQYPQQSARKSKTGKRKFNALGCKVSDISSVESTSESETVDSPQEETKSKKSRKNTHFENNRPNQDVKYDMKGKCPVRGNGRIKRLSRKESVPQNTHESTTKSHEMHAQAGAVGPPPLNKPNFAIITDSGANNEGVKSDHNHNMIILNLKKKVSSKAKPAVANVQLDKQLSVTPRHHETHAKDRRQPPQKIPNFTLIDPELFKDSAEEQKTAHERIVLKLVKNGGKWELKKDPPDSNDYVEEGDEEDNEKTLLYGFDGPYGKIVKD